VIVHPLGNGVGQKRDISDCAFTGETQSEKSKGKKRQDALFEKTVKDVGRLDVFLQTRTNQ
jgi:hypothetical protein